MASPRIRLVKPLAALPVEGSFECEIKTARVINNTKTEMFYKNKDAVNCLFFQSKKLQKKKTDQVFISIMLMVIPVLFGAIITARKDQVDDKVLNLMLEMILCVFAQTSLLGLGNALPNIGNALRYRSNKKACEAWLSEQSSSLRP